MTVRLPAGSVRFQRLLILLSVALFGIAALDAAPLSPGNIAIYRVGDGVGALTANGTAAFIDEYTPAGAYLQTIPIPTITSGANRRLTASGSQAEGFLNRSVDGNYLLVAGYDAALGAAGVGGTSSTTVNRVVARIDASGNINTTTALSDASTGGNIRGVASPNGTDLWVEGSAGGVRYTTLGATTSVQLSTTVTNLRAVQIFNNQLYVSDASGSTVRLGPVGSGLPTTAGQTIANLPGFLTGTGSPYGFFFADLDAGVPGLDTLYVADDGSAASGGGVQKWSLVGSTWIARGTLTSAGARGITGVVNGSSVTLYVANGTALQKFTDNTGYNATVTGAMATIATAATNTAFRGVALTPGNAGGNNPPSITPTADPISIVSQNAAPFTVSATGFDDGGVYTWSATPGTGVSSVAVTGGQGQPTATFTVTLQNGFNGTAKFIASLSDGVNAAATRELHIQVNPLLNSPPTITAPDNPITTVQQDNGTFTVGLSGHDDGSVYNWSASAVNGIASLTTNLATTSSPTFSVTLVAGFSGTAKFVASLSDNVNAAVTQDVFITVQPITPPNHIVISQVYGGGGNANATYTNDYVELYNPTDATVSLTGWSLQYASATGSGWDGGKQPIGGQIQPGKYYLVSMATGGDVGAPLPDANILGNINMSATTGKIALVNNSDSLSGNCPVGDPHLVDFVGWGTANCWEGTGDAPAPSNTKAIYRRSGGLRDTDNNVADFEVLDPLPRRTEPVVELGPWLAGTDPRSGGTTIPRDASVTVDFSEPVDVAAGWYNINCPSGPHNNATVAHTSDFKEYVITPNTNFTFGETCTVTINHLLVHDRDTDDSLPDTDTLFADVTWSFLVVGAGEPAPYPPTVHLAMGNPSNATADLGQPNNYLMEKPTYVLSYNKEKGTPNWVSWHLDTSWFGSLARVDTFRPDPALPADWYRVQAFDFFTTGFDRGHMTPNADRDNENRIPINQETYLMTNMVPQAPDNNQGPWANLENYLRSILNVSGQEYELYIVSGPAGEGGTGSNGGVTHKLAGDNVTVPAFTWKVALVLPKASGDDVARVTAATRTIAVIMPNVQGIRTNDANDWQAYLTSVDAVEALTHYNFFSNVPEAVQNAIEAGVNGANPPGAADKTISTNEDTAKTFTVDAVSPSGNALTYTITSTAAHGTASVAAGSFTYTPAPDFNGSDSFSYTVSDGSHTSNTANVTISVLEVNDPPSAVNDSKSTNEDTSLTFPASDLTANDSTGPANESGQTLAVNAVNATADTHGAVAFSNGQITYTPAANYNGPASFTYHVCDDGITAGATTPKCADAIVSINVNPVNDPPSATVNAPSTGTEGSSVTATASAIDVDANDTATFAWTVTKNGAPFATGAGPSITFTPDDNGSYVATATAIDGGGATGSASKTVDVTNVAPVVGSVTGPAGPIPVGSETSIRIPYTDAGTADTHTATFSWADGSSSTATCGGGTCTASHTYSNAGVFAVTIDLTDDDGGAVSSRFEYVVVFDANGGVVTGGGWIDSPAGAYALDPALTGKATFGFVSKYQKGQTTPSGNTEFQFHAAKLNFTATAYEWLVIAGSKAQYKGTGTINGAGSYAFMITAVDGDTKTAKGVDKFRIKIWDKVTGGRVYDNKAGASDDLDSADPQQIGGGNITISSSK